MNSIEPNFKRISKIYEKAKNWIISADIIFLFIIFYFGDILGPWREKLLVAAALGVLAILFEILISISNNLKIEPEMSLFPSISEALAKIKEIVSHDKQTTSIKIIAATGGATLATILPSIISSSPARKIEISIGILDPNTPYKEWIPSHWPSESKTTIERFKTEFKDDRISINLFLFKILPVPHGLLINNEHLFLGFFSWIKNGEKSHLSGAQLPHHYYHVSKPESINYFNLFESWFMCCPQKLNSQKMFIFDFDGTLVDSYISLPDAYTSIAHYIGLQGDIVSKFVNEMIKSEDQQDALRNYDRHRWWPVVFKQFNIHISEERLIQLIKIYWEQRTNRSKIIDKSEEILKSLKNRGILAIVCVGDGKHGNKKERIQKSGLGRFFDEIIIVGEDVENLTQAVKLLIEKYNINRDEVVVFDDKPFPINEMSKNMKDITTVKIEFEGILKLAWAEKCTPAYRIRTINEVKGVVDA